MKKILCFIAIISLTACQGGFTSINDRMVESGHLNQSTPEVELATMDIPPVVEQVPIIAVPEPAEKLQTFTVVATDLPANELLFALARDARLNLDIDPTISSNVSINAINQTLPQILKRISRQVALRYYLDGPNLVVEQDRPFIRIYKIDYLNISRSTNSSVEVATEIASTGTSAEGGGGGGSNSSTSVENEMKNDFWKTLEENIAQLTTVDGQSGQVISNRESGIISVRTTSAAHDDVQRFIDQVLNSARRQVLIEATVVEVTLSDDFQSGIDWSSVPVGDGWALEQSLLAGTLGTPPFLTGIFTDTSASRTVSATISALDTFGEVSVMSSPKIMALNNQTSILKVVDNRVYFSVEAQTTAAALGGIPVTSFTTTIKTVPVGFVMSVTPFISNDGEVTLNIRPTISRILQFVPDPNPDLAAAGVTNLVPEIQVREMESVLRVADGNTAIIGGLMQDAADKNSAGIPGLHNIPGVGLLFGTKGRLLNKTELVIFLRPRIINNASLDTNLRDFKRYLNPQVYPK